MSDYKNPERYSSDGHQPVMPGNVFYGNNQSSSLKTAREMLSAFFDPDYALNSYGDNTVPVQELNFPKLNPVDPVTTPPRNVDGAALQRPDFNDGGNHRETKMVKGQETHGASNRLPRVLEAAAKAVLNAREAAVESPAATDDQFATAA